MYCCFQYYSLLQREEIADDNGGYEDYEVHGYGDDPWYVVNTANMVDDSMDVHTEDMVDDTVVVANKHKMDAGALGLMEHSELVG